MSNDPDGDLRRTGRVRRTNVWGFLEIYGEVYGEVYGPESVES